MPLLALLALITACSSEPDDTGAASVDSATLDLTVANVSAPGALVASDASAHDIKLAPGLYVVHQPGFTLFQAGSAASAAIEHIAEDGDPADLFAALLSEPAVRDAGTVASQDGETYEDAPILPGEAATETVLAEVGDQLSFICMYGESNDVFVATSAPVALFDANGPLTGDLTAALALFDAGTELNQEPGLGEDQAPRQSAAGQGEAEGGTITQLTGPDAGGWTYPAIAEFMAVSLDLGELTSR